MAAAPNDNLASRLRPLDKLEVAVLVDNVTDTLSTVPAGVTNELVNLARAGVTCVGGSCLCCAHFGLSLVITATAGGRRHTILFDTGPEAYAVERNGDRMKVDFGAVGSVVLSHGHWDHGGGVLKALELIRSSNGGQPIDLHVNPGMFVPRALRFPDGTLVSFMDLPKPAELAQHGAEVVNSAEPRLLQDECFYLSGEIPRVTPFEKGLPGQMARTSPDGDWEPDPLIMDERYLAVNLAGKGVLVFSACSHAGLINVLRAAQSAFATASLYGVMGGFHLSGATEPIIPDTVRELESFGLKKIIPGHCTGWRALSALLQSFGDEIVVPCAVGRRFVFE
jgi:7,8-dihydropterin-6-yl-methyl-4-(beta-D-ribofuranosyl)aminobenzene 5'-phosphate synthase